MRVWNACVRNGRLILNEPTDLPDGEIVELVPLQELGDLGDEERAELDADLEASFEGEEGGQLIDLADAIADLRASK